MKNYQKILALVCALTMAISFAACSKSDDSTSTTSADSESTTEVATSKESIDTTLRDISTTAQATESETNEEALQKALKKELNCEDSAITSMSPTGSFTYNNVDGFEKNAYSQEYSEKYKNKAKENADSLAEALEKVYGDNITFSSMGTNKIGSDETDNGIDSALYELVYYNSQNQALKINCMSDGTIYNASCNFTW